jgi:hypothetical protein
MKSKLKKIVCVKSDRGCRPVDRDSQTSRRNSNNNGRFQLG